ncbi:MAG: MFS transporter, partial [Butyrivibrio sp.]|nr:MFS transporter [Butyrivibrio sp.]
MAVVVAIVIVNCSIYITSNRVIYFFKYDFGGTGWKGDYTLFSTFGGGIQILAMMLLYPILTRFFTSIHIYFVSMGMAICGYISLLILASTSMNNVFLLFIPAFFIFAANGMLAVITTVFLANTVDYGDLKNNRRDESVIFSMQTFVVKLASGVSALIASLALQILALSNETEEGAGLVDYSAGVDGMQKMGLRMTMTIIPIIGIVFAIFWFRKKYILTDEKLQEISVELVKRKTIETEDQSAN